MRVALRLFLPPWERPLRGAPLIFLIVGAGTIYLLYRAGRTDFGVFATFGALYTPLSWLLLSPIHPLHWNLFLLQLRELPAYAVIGALSGILTILIIFGRRRNAIAPLPAL
jgi:MFS superfamily sulfate permease-like transporter